MTQVPPSGRALPQLDDALESAIADLLAGTTDHRAPERATNGAADGDALGRQLVAMLGEALDLAAAAGIHVLAEGGEIRTAGREPSASLAVARRGLGERGRGKEHRGAECQRQDGCLHMHDQGSPPSGPASCLAPWPTGVGRVVPSRTDRKSVV